MGYRKSRQISFVGSQGMARGVSRFFFLVFYSHCIVYGGIFFVCDDCLGFKSVCTYIFSRGSLV